MNVGLVVVVVVIAWSALSLVVAAGVGAMAKPRDAGAQLVTPAAADDGFRAAV